MKHIQRFKKITNFCIKNNYITKDPFFGFKISFKKSNRVYVTNNELHTLQNITLNSSLSKVRDIFLFACYTGLSYIDLYNLSLKNITKGIDNLQWIYVKRQKTNIPSNIPILPAAFSILKKYKKQKNINRIFPMISNQKINKALKEISNLCNFNKKLTFHSARHTFATTVTLTNGVPIESVSRMLGHNNIKTTQIYAQVIDSKISSDMLILRQKFI
jgi:site-specific recombinase XerD